MIRPPTEAQRCTCPSGDGSLRWPCPAHPAEAQPCGCGEATCTVPWEPGCGLGKSEQHAVVQAQPVGEVRLHNGLLYGRLDGDFPVGTKLYAHPPPSAPVGVDAIRIADDLESWVNDPFVTLTPMRKMDVEDFVRRIRALAQQPAAVDGVHELSLCESSRLHLFPDRLYRFTVDPKCSMCAEAALAAQPGGSDNDR